MPPQARAVVMALQECPWCCSLLTVTVPSQESQAWNMGRPESCLAQVNDNFSRLSHGKAEQTGILPLQEAEKLLLKA